MHPFTWQLEWLKSDRDGDGDGNGDGDGDGVRNTICPGNTFTFPSVSPLRNLVRVRRSAGASGACAECAFLTTSMASSRHDSPHINMSRNAL